MPLIDVQLRHREIPEHPLTGQEFQQPHLHEPVAGLVGVNEFPEELERSPMRKTFPTLQSSRADHGARFPHRAIGDGGRLTSCEKSRRICG